MLKKGLILIFILVFLFLIVGFGEEINFPKFPKGHLTITQGSKKLTIPIEIADRDELHSFGLMYRKDIPWNFGMLFIFSQDVSYGFWMKNTYVPLEIAFINSQKIIFNIQKMYPCKGEDCPIYYSPKPYRYALEVKMGFFEKFGFKEGAKIDFKKN